MLVVSTAARAVHFMTRSRHRIRIAALAALAAAAARRRRVAQDRSNGNFLDNLFNRGDQATAGPRRAAPGAAARGADRSRRHVRPASTASKRRCASSPARSKNCSIRTRCCRCSSSACRTTPSTASSSLGRAAPPRHASRANAAAVRRPMPPGGAPRPAAPTLFDPCGKSQCARRAAHARQRAVPSPRSQNAETLPIGAPGGRAARCAARSVDACRQSAAAAAAERADGQRGGAAGAAIAAAAGAQYQRDRRAARDAAAVGDAEGRIRHGLRLCAA